jgi:hypothetical protein
MVLRVADQLCAELGCVEGATEVADSWSSGHRGDGMWGVLTVEDESLVRTIKSKLAQIAAAVSAVAEGDPPADTVCAALDGAEMVMRGELVSGNADRLVTMMPSFVFLVTVPIVEQDQALILSRRTAELIELELRA